MDIRAMAQTRWGQRGLRALDRVNARHPWNHNDAFHPWILTRLPECRGVALDIGCGRGELAAVLGTYFDRVVGVDTSREMRDAAASRCRGLSNVEIVAENPVGPGQVDLVTMVAVLHHLDLAAALAEVRGVLAPGGRFLCVGLTRPVTTVDQLWDVASMVTNPLIGMVRHPWAAVESPAQAGFPTTEPTLGFDEIADVVCRELPGAVMRRHLAFRFTIEWSKPTTN